MKQVHAQYFDILKFFMLYDWKRVPNPAVVLDIDETTICNIPGVRYKGQSLQGRAIPGALAVVDYLNKRGVAVFFITARPRESKEHTTRQLFAEGFRFKGVFHQNRQKQPDYATYKRQARELIATHHTIVACIGDQVADVNSHCEAAFLIVNPFYRV